MKSTLYYLHALSALHVGTGQGAGVIDLPIAREKATHLPYAPGSGLKGVLREEMKPANGSDRSVWEALFGPARVMDDEGFAGALAIGDAHLLCLPVRSLAGTFAWGTCPFILARYRREAIAVGLAAPDLPGVLNDEGAMTSTSTLLKHQDKVVLEDLDLNAQAGADAWAEHIASTVFGGDTTWQELFKQRFAILPDGVFDFLAETATEVRARIRIKEETRTVAKGMLWYEENLPAETLLYGVVGADRARRGGGSDSEMLNQVTPKLRLQLGGKATVGRGLVNWIKQEV
ncbi:MAG: type III-B CRISPR module RAMP protein Cmr4 [Desulfobacteraceae bacterium]|nr:type III-B CRISPR module RAMP protein Cmr4 [Desulfobacteraceae bacterium]